jgi:hypothetical protein
MNENEIITLYTFKDVMEATLAMDILKENGIDSFLSDETNAGINPLGGVELKVFLKDKETADALIEEFKN